MSRRRERELGRRLHDLPAGDESAAQERAWEVVRAAHAERVPALRRRRTGRIALALAAVAGLLVVGLSPAGARVADLVTDVVRIGSQDARPELGKLPAAGELLVEADDGAWIVRADGSKRRLGDYEQVDWSPNGWYVAAASGRQLAAVDPLGEAQWTVTAPAAISDARWSGTNVDTRIAYRAGDDLRVVAGDGTGDARIARDVAPVAPAWLSVPETKLGPGVGAGSHVLAYAATRSRVEVVDAGSGEVLERIELPGGAPVEAIEFSADGRLLLVRTASALHGLDPASGRRSWHLRAETSAAALSPDGSRVAAVTAPDQPNGESRLLVVDAETGAERRLPAGLGRFSDVAWSPDGRWLVLGWEAADQWLFVRLEPDRRRRVVAVGEVSPQFDPGGTEATRFPQIAGWLLPNRP